MKLYLITGFLGAGKTTFLRKFVKLFPDQKIALIINEFGKEGVDGTLLADVGAAVHEINNGSIFCACKLEQFEDAILDVIAQQPDLIFVEASGLSDPTQVRSVIRQPAKFGDLEYGGALCLLDGKRFHKVFQTARVCRMQLAISDMVLITKADIAAPEKVQDIHNMVQAQRPNRPVHAISHGEFDRAWLEEIVVDDTIDSSPIGHIMDVTLSKFTVHIEGLSQAELQTFLQHFAEDTYRAKGFLQCTDGFFLADCVGPLISITPWCQSCQQVDEGLVVLFGNGLPAKKSVKAAMAQFPQATFTVV